MRAFAPHGYTNTIGVPGRGAWISAANAPRNNATQEGLIVVRQELDLELHFLAIRLLQRDVGFIHVHKIGFDLAPITACPGACQHHGWKRKEGHQKAAKARGKWHEAPQVENSTTG